MRAPDRLKLESVLLDVLMERRTRHEAAAWAREALAFDLEREEPGEGGSVFVYRSWDRRRLLPWVLSWGASARVLSPPEAIDRVRQEADALVQRYAEA